MTQVSTKESRDAAIESIASSHGVKTGEQMTAFVEALLIAIWLGSMMFFSFAVAPSAFAVLPTRELAGAVVTSTIGKVEILGLVIGPILMIIRSFRSHSSNSSRVRILHLVLLAVMIAAASLSRFWISPQMVSLRREMGGHIDDVPITDPLRVQFNSLHQYSVSLMGTAIVAGLIVLFLIVRSWLNRSKRLA